MKKIFFLLILSILLLPFRSVAAEWRYRAIRGDQTLEIDLSTASDVVTVGVLADRPAASTPAGSLFFATDSVMFFKDNGTSWDNYGPIYYVTPPSSEAFPLWLNWGASTSMTISSACLSFSDCATATAHKNRIMAASCPAGPYTVTACFSPNSASGYDARFGIARKDSATGKIQTLELSHTSNHYNIGFVKWNSHSSFNSNAFQTAMEGQNFPHYIRWQEDGTNTLFWNSYDGLHWVLLYSVSSTTWLANPDQIGIFNNTYTANASAPFTASLIHWTVTTP